MNKTFTAAIAITAVAGLASAAIETAPAGYIDKGGSSILVCNPFYSFSNGATTKLADIDGSSLATGDRIATVSASGAMTEYKWAENIGWVNMNNEPVDVSLDRGDAIVFNGTSMDYPLVISGLLTNAAVSAKSQTAIGYKLVGNASAVSKPLSAFSVDGDYNPNYDYVQLRGVKYIYKNGWKVRETGLTPDPMPQVESGEGLFLYCQSTRKRKAGGLNVTITVPDDRE